MATRGSSDDHPTGPLAERFAALWETRSVDPPDVVAFLSGYPEAATAERLAVVLADQQARWRAGLGRPVAAYLAAFPDLAADPALAGALERGERDALDRQSVSGDTTQDAAAERPGLTETPDLGWWPGSGPSPDLMATVVEGAATPAGGTVGAWATASAAGRTRTASDAPTLRGDDDPALDFRLDTGPAAGPDPGDATAVPRYSARFTIDHRLGAGGMGVVYQAFDHDRGEQVALKTMRRIDPLALYRFKQEFRSLADLSHPNLVNLYELIALGEVWFFTMELVPGVDFISHVRSRPGGDGPVGRVPPTEPLGAEQVTRLRQAVRQLAEGVEALHDAGKLHRDIKPPNVLVTDEGRVVLLDFGLTADLGRSGLLPYAAGERVVGTVAYMAPEQATGRALSTAADWYSVGVILYEALAGVLPIGGTPDEVLAEKLRTDPPPPGEVAAGVPADLNALCVDLLRRDPAARPTGAEVLARLSAEPTRPGPARGDRSAFPLIGRERHREALHAALAEVEAGRPVLMFVSGRPGSGKTALLQSFLDGLPEDGAAAVLSGRCYEREAVPFKALDSVVDELSRFLLGLPAGTVRALLPRDVALLARMFPVLRRVEGVAAAPGAGAEAADQQEIRRRAVAALRELLAAIGRDRPLILAIDDLQWGDPENAGLIEELIRPPGAPVMLLIGAYRSDAADDSPLVRALLRSGAGGSGRRELEVGALTSVESRELALALLGRADPLARAEAHVVARESQGNPFFIAELVKHIQAGGGLSGQGASADRLALVGVIRGRVGRLPDDARRLLEVVAVSGRPVGLLDACQAAGLGVGGRTAAAALRAGRLIRGTVRPHRDEVETYHDWVRETVVAHLPAEVVASHHLRLAQVLEAGGRADAETLAVHYQGGGWPGRAAENYARAAEKSVATLAFAHAAALYRLALALRPARPGGDPEAVRLRTRLADALAAAGRGHEAATEYLDAAAAAPAADALELKRRAALQFLISGHVDDGFGLLRTVLDARGMSMPSGPTGALLALVRRRAWLRVRGLDYTHRDATQVSAELLSLTDLCWSAGAGLSLIDPVRGADFQTRGLLLALRAGEPYRVARALTLEAATLALGGRAAAGRAAALLARAEDVARPLNHPHVAGLIALARGVAALMVGRWKDACRGFAHAEPLLRDRCTGVAWELDTVHNLWLWALTYLGDLAELRRRWQVFLKEARERGDLYAVTTMSTYYMALLRLADDEPARALAETDGVMARWSRLGYHVQHASALRARATAALYQGNAACAWEQVTAEWPRYRHSLLPRVQWIRVQMTELRARCALAVADAAPRPAALLRGAERDARALERERVPWAAAHALLVRAGVAARRGDRPGALTLLRDATAAYDAAEMRLHACACRRSAGRLLTGAPGRALVDQADEALGAQGVRDPAAFAATFAPWFPVAADASATFYSGSGTTNPERFKK